MVVESEKMEMMVFCFREEVEEFFASMDRDFDGRLTFEEFMGEETTLEKLFKNMDKNGDGVVTKQVQGDTVCIRIVAGWLGFK